MKQLHVFILSFLCIIPLRGQELDSLMHIMEGQKNPAGKTELQEPATASKAADSDTISLKLGDKEVIKVIESRDSTYVQLGAKEYIVVDDRPDSTNIRIGKRDISIVEKDNDSEISIRKNERYQAFQSKFKGHWAGFGWGFNNLLDERRMNAFLLAYEGIPIEPDRTTQIDVLSALGSEAEFLDAPVNVQGKLYLEMVCI